MNKDKALFAERDWWDEIGNLFDTSVIGWTGKHAGVFDKGLTIKGGRVAAKLHEYAMLLAANKTTRPTDTEMTPFEMASCRLKANTLGWRARKESYE